MGRVIVNNPSGYKTIITCSLAVLYTRDEYNILLVNIQLPTHSIIVVCTVLAFNLPSLSTFLSLKFIIFYSKFKVLWTFSTVIREV